MRAFRLAWLELQKFRGVKRRWIPAMLVIIPLAAGSIGMMALWHPQAHFDSVPAAFVNEDAPTDVPPLDGKAVVHVDAGSRLTEQIQLARHFAWRSLDREDAEKQLQNGQIYFYLVIPRDFSTRISAYLSGGGAESAEIRLQLDDSNGYLIGVSAEEYTRTVQEEALKITLSYAAMRTTDTWKNLRESIDKILNSSRALKSEPGPQQTTPAPASGGSAAEQLASGVADTNNAINRVNDIVQSVNSSSGKMAFQLNNAAGTAQATQDNINSGNAALVNQSAVQTTSTVKLAQDQVNALSVQLQQAADSAKDLVFKSGDIAIRAKTLSASLVALEGELKVLAQSIPAPKTLETGKVQKEPVAVEVRRLHPSRFLGRALAPLTLSMMALISVLFTVTALRAVNLVAIASPMNALSIACAGVMTPALIASLTAAGLFIVTQALFDINALHPWATLLCCIVTGSCFATLGILLKVALAGAGELLFLLFASLQFTASGGLYPVQTTNAFFATLSPFLPMTYAVDALRTTISGGDNTRLVTALVVQGCAILVCVAVTAFLVSRQRAWTDDRLDPALRERCE